MGTQSHPGQAMRSASIAVTATALVALVAMSAPLGAAPAPRAAAIEGRFESGVVRAVAAVVAAAARELGGERLIVAAAWLEGSTGHARPESCAAAPRGAMGLPPPPLLGERLLDLPPPAC